MSPKISQASRLLLLAVAVVLGAATVYAAVARLSDALPINPWEPAIAMEAMRLNAGLPIYEAGHASHMYGPLLTVALAGVFRLAGLNLLAARIILSIFGFALSWLLVAILCREKSRPYCLLIFLLFLGINFRTNLIFLSAQPDCAAAFFAVLGLYLWIRREASITRAALSVALFLCAAFLKQTSAAFALIPIAYVLLCKQPTRLSEIGRACIPALSILLAFAVVRLAWPQMFWSIATVPAMIKVYYERAFRLTTYLLVTFPIFMIAAVAAFRRRNPIDERERWVWSAAIVLIPVSIWTICKSGGSYNSLLFAYLAMTALFALKLDAILDWIASLRTWRSLGAAMLLAVAILYSFLIEFDRVGALAAIRCGDEKYENTVTVARNLDGKVISPQDPTIAYRANGYFGRSLFFELDTHAVNGNWPKELPAAITEEMAGAKFVIQIRSYVVTPVFERGLLAGHFRPLSIPALKDSAYSFWVKAEE